jgi:hypothetical protein
VLLWGDSFNINWNSFSRAAYEHVPSLKKSLVILEHTGQVARGEKDVVNYNHHIAFEEGGPVAISSIELFTNNLRSLFQIMGEMRITEHDDTIASGLQFPGQYLERQLRDISEISGSLVVTPSLRDLSICCMPQSIIV